MRINRKGKILLLTCVVLSCIVLVSSASAQPGSDADPLVTKSYVDQKVAQLSTELTAKISTGSGTGSSSGFTDGAANGEVISQLQTDMGDLYYFLSDALTKIEALEGRVAALESGYVVVEAQAGQKIILAGGSEAILRSGSAEAIVGQYGGLVNASIGADIDKNGMNIPYQNLLISSRSDGRGLSIKERSFLLIRGAFEIK